MAAEQEIANIVTGVMLGFLPLVLLSIPMAYGNYLIAKRINRSGAIWALLTLLPFVNYFFLFYVFYVVILAMFDRLNSIVGKLDRHAS